MLFICIELFNLIAKILVVPSCNLTKHLVNEQFSSIIYIENIPTENAGYRYGAASWAQILREAGFQLDIWAFYEDEKEFEKYN